MATRYYLEWDINSVITYKLQSKFHYQCVRIPFIKAGFMTIIIVISGTINVYIYLENIHHFIHLFSPLFFSL